MIWVAPIYFVYKHIAKKRIENYLSLLIDRKPLNMAEARNYIIELFKAMKTETEIAEKS
ncbi:MAG: hypothetical protein QW279_06785 [Candidatus Jordarchaeaceae archaeon]